MTPEGIEAVCEELLAAMASELSSWLASRAKYGQFCQDAASTKHVVIVDAGFAGLNCARKLASDSSANPLWNY